jgi:hypothetical protein
VITPTDTKEPYLLELLMTTSIYKGSWKDYCYQQVVGTAAYKLEEDSMNKLYVTFGQIHLHKVDGQILDKDSIAVIDCATYDLDRLKAQELFGMKFCFTYFNSEWNPEDIRYYPRGYILI